jgi:hypothetical protein
VLLFFSYFELPSQVVAKMHLAKIIPEWINQSFFEKVIRQMEKDQQASVFNFDIAAVSNFEENFASAVFRASITFKSKYTKTDKTDKTISVIIKTKPSLGPEYNTEYAALLKSAPFSRNEMELYDKILPDIQSLLLSAGDKDILSPK